MALQNPQKRFDLIFPGSFQPDFPPESISAECFLGGYSALPEDACFPTFQEKGIPLEDSDRGVFHPQNTPEEGKGHTYYIERASSLDRKKPSLIYIKVLPFQCKMK